MPFTASQHLLTHTRVEVGGALGSSLSLHSLQPGLLTSDRAD